MTVALQKVQPVKKRRRFTEEEVEHLLRLVYDEGISTPEAARIVGMVYSPARAIVVGETWKDVHRRIVGDREPPKHPTTPRGEQHKKAKLTQKQVDEIRRRVRMGEHKRNLAWEYDVSQRTIHRIAINESWKKPEESP